MRKLSPFVSIVICIGIIPFLFNVNENPPVRAHHAIIYNEASKSIFMTGGSTPLNGGSSFKFFNDVWTYDGKSWKQQAQAGDERSGIALAYDAKRNQIYSYGGFTGNNQSHGELRVFENNEWSTISDIPEMNAAEAGLVYDRYRDKLIAFGGSAARGQLNSTTWEWDGTKKEWEKIEGIGPEGRQAFAMVYDNKRKKTVLYGGMGSTPKDQYTDVWEYDGSRWTKIVAEGPGKRLSPGCTYDEKNEMMLLFGGVGSNGFTGDTWGWNGKEWKKLAETGPAKRAMGYMAYDKARGKTVLFGGRLGWPNDTNDTWEWDGKNWSEVKSQ